ncbi:7,8-dihydroneopterin aldolase [Bacteroidia bacterium]|nr:7,8-dihydroneopterin aldolase [Bacteroidia bacterium]
MVTAKIELKNMRFYAYHGVFPQERSAGNHFVVNLQLKAPLEKAASTDNPDDTIDYGEVFRIVANEMSIPSQLLEHVAGRILHALKSRFPQITEIEAAVSKLNPPIAGADLQCATVTLSWKSGGE